MLQISLSPDAGEVFISSPDISAGLRAELTHLLIAHGGIPQASGFRIPILGFRRSAVDLAAILRDAATAIQYDSDVERLLRTHLAEIRARHDAESLAPLTTQEVRAAVYASGRFLRPLTDPQIRDIGRLLILPHGANFSVPGAGKTATLLAVYEALRTREQVTRLLVVAPKNAFLSWESESEKCYGNGGTPILARLVGGRTGVDAALARDPEIAIVGYQLLPNAVDLVQPWVHRNATHLVLDESHRIKGGLGGVTARAAIQLSTTAIRRDILTGTPLPQAPEDLRPQFDFLWPGQRILPDTRLAAESPPELLDQIQRSVRHLYVRTTKSELNLPTLEVVPVSVDLGPLQRELYELLRSEARRLSAGMPSMDRRFFRMLGRHVVRLLQAASNPMLLTGGDLPDDDLMESPPFAVRAWDLLREYSRYERPAKISAAADRVNHLLAANPAAKVVIWTSFILNIHALERLLREYNPVTLYGAVEIGTDQDPETREGRIRTFHNDPTCRVMVANPAAGGEGISLHEVCHHAIYLDRTFNAAHYLQSADRIHRLGLPSHVVTRIEILEARDTIDQRVARRLRVKLDSMAHILSDPGLAAMAYDPEDIVEDFPAGLEPEDVEEVIDHLVEGQDRPQYD